MSPCHVHGVNSHRALMAMTQGEVIVSQGPPALLKCSSYRSVLYSANSLKGFVGHFLGFRTMLTETRRLAALGVGVPMRM